jgi:DNA repair exonuclease SbcCD ATPase subunit
MARQIKSSDIFEGDIFELVRKSAIDTIGVLDKMNAELQKTAKTMKTELGSLKLDSLKSIQEMIKLTERANQLNKESEAINKARTQAVSAKTRAELEALAIEKQKQQVNQETIKTEREQLKLTKDQERAEKAKAKEQEKAAKTARDEASAYKQLEKNTRDLKNQSKELAAQMLSLEANGRKNTKEYRELAAQYKNVTAAAQKGDKALKDIDKRVGDNFRNVGNYQSALGGLKNALGALGIAFGARQVVTFLKESVDLARVQQNAVNQVQVGLETTGNKVGYSLDQLKEKATQFQKETLFGDEEIMTDLTSVLLTFTSITGDAFDRAQQAALDLSTRLGQDLKSSAVQLGKALNDPVKGVTALRRVGVSFTQSQMDQIKTLQASGKLYEAQTIILNELNTEFGGSAKAAAAADGGLTQLANAWGDVKEVIGQTLIDAIKPSVAALRDFFLNLKPETIKNFVSSIGTLISVLFKVGKAYLTYRGIILATQLIERARLTNFKDLGNAMLGQIPMTKQYAQAQKDAAKATQEGNVATKGLGSALAGIGWTVAIMGAYELGTSLYRAATGQASLENALISYENTRKKIKNKVDADTEITNKTLKQQYKQKEIDIYLLQKEGKTRIKNGENAQKVNAEIQKQEKKINDEFKKSIYDRDFLGKTVFQRNQDQIDLYQSKINQLASDNKALREIENKTGESRYAGITQNTNAIVEYQEKIKGLYKDSQIRYKLLKQDNELLAVNETQQEENTKKVIAAQVATKNYAKELQITNEYLTTQNELLAEIDKLKFQKTIDAKQQEIDILLANDIKYATETGNVQVDALEKLINEKFELEKQALEDQKKLRIQKLEEDYQGQTQKEIEELKKKRDELLQKEIEAQVKYNNEIQKIQEQSTEISNEEDEMDEEFDEKKKAKAAEKIGKQQEKLAQQQADLAAKRAEERKRDQQIAEEYDKQIEKINQNDLQRKADLELEKQKLDLETSNQSIELEKKRSEEINKINDDLIAAQEEYYEKLDEASRKQLEDEFNKRKQIAEQQKQLFQLGTEYFIKQSEARISQIDKEIAAAEKQSDILKQLAAEGNIDAKQSLAEQQRIINEANLRKEKEQRRQQRLQLLNTAFQTYNSKVEQGSKNPLTETIRDIGLLRAFIETIPAFEKGTEDTGVNGKGVDGKGGFHAILHPNERVIPKSMNQKIGSMSNEQLTKLAQEYQNGRIIKPNEQIGSALDTAVLINKLDELTQTIKLKPETNIELGEITQSMMEVVKSTKKGNTTTYNRYKIRK